MKRVTLLSTLPIVLCFAGGPALTMTASGAEPFNGKDLTGWSFRGSKEKSKWTVGKALYDANKAGSVEAGPGGSDLVNTAGGGVDLYTDAKYGDVLIEVEVLVPKGSNSGVYVMGEYEVQVFDSFGKKEVETSDMGGIYQNAAPKVNAATAPGTWQKFTIDFKAPKFDAAGKKTASAKFVKVTLNGQVIHENVEVKSPTASCLTGKEAATGPIMLQGDHGPVAYRNLKVTPIKVKP